MRADTATTFNEREDRFLTSAARADVLALPGVLVLRFSADECFVDLNGLALAA
jgi:hypothetical protein